MPLHYDISERIKTEPAQLWAAKHLFSIKKERFHLSTCHTVFCIYFGSLSSELWFDLTSPQRYFTSSQINTTELQAVARRCQRRMSLLALCSTASLLRARQQETHSWWAGSRVAAECIGHRANKYICLLFARISPNHKAFDYSWLD